MTMLVSNKDHAHLSRGSSQGSPPDPLLHKPSQPQVYPQTKVLNQNMHPEGQASRLAPPDIIPSKTYPVFRPNPTCT